MKQKRIFITGGHFMPAQAVIEELQKRGGWEIFYLGRKNAMEDDAARALEYQAIRSIANVTYLVLTTGRVQPKFFVNLGQSIKAFLKIFLGLGQSLYLVLRYNPDVVLSFGGYMAVPVVFWAYLLGIPIATHEQTVVSGRANKLLAKLADKVLVSWPETLSHFSKDKVVLTGNPLRQTVSAALAKKLPQAAGRRPLIYITGGSQGSQAINAAVLSALPKLLKSYKVIHQTGDANNSADFLALSRFTGANYQVKKFLDSVEVTKAFQLASLVVTRAGANIVTEVLAAGIPTLFIPIPWSPNQEQMANAKMVVAVGLGEILPQDKLTGKSLVETVAKMLKNRQQYQSHAVSARQLLLPDAASRIADQVGAFIIS